MSRWLKDCGHAPIKHARSGRSQHSDSLRHDSDEEYSMGGVIFKDYIVRLRCLVWGVWNWWLQKEGGEREGREGKKFVRVELDQYE